MSAAADGAAADCVVANGAGLAGATGDIDGAAAGPQTPPPPTPLRGEPLAPREVQGAVGAALAGAMTALAIFLGDRLGLYRALADLSAGGGGSSGSAAAAATSAELAAAKGLSERFVREWLFQQASARLVECDERAERFWMTQAQQDVLANEDGPGASPHFFAGAAGGALRLADDREALVEAFRTGVGLPYDGHGEGCAMGVKRELGVWTRHHLIDNLRRLPGGAAARLAAGGGAAVADVGCGAGLAACLVARAFAGAAVHGYDISKHALALARKDAAAAGLANLEFRDCSEPDGGLPTSPTYDLIYVLDALHDMARPDEVLRAIRAALKPDGLFLICDIKGLPGGAAANIASHPMAPLMYGYSVACCLGSGLSAPGGLGLGTLGFDREVAERMTREAGFSAFEALDWESDMNAYYLVRP